jgi:hypothetical protein
MRQFTGAEMFIRFVHFFTTGIVVVLLPWGFQEEANFSQNLKFSFAF